MDPIEVITEFKKRRKRQFVLLGVIIPLVIFIFIVKDKADGDLFGFSYDQIAKGGLVLVALSLLFSFFNWKCPNCKKYLGRDLFITSCRSCNESFK